MKKEPATVPIRLSPTNRMRLKRYGEKLAHKNKLLVVSHNDVIGHLLDTVKQIVA